MKDVKSIISARVALGAEVTKKAQITSITLLDRDEKGRIPAVVRLTKDVPAMVQVNQNMIDACNREIISIEKAINDATDEELKATLTGDLEDRKAWIAANPLDSWTKSVSNTIFCSNFDFLAIIRQMPKAAFLAKKISVLESSGDEGKECAEDMYNGIFNYATTSILAESVTKDTMYISPFSDKPTSVKNNNIYHTLFNTELGDEGLDFVKSLRRRHMDSLMNRADKVSSRRSASADDDDDDED